MPTERDSRDGVAVSSCPYCRRKLDAATHVDGPKPNAAPEPGDATVCFYCAAVLVFDDAGGVREPTLTERAELLEDPRIIDVAGAVLLYRAVDGG